MGWLWYGRPMAIDFYGYKRCDTCRKAEKFLAEAKVEYRFIDITEQAPTLAQLKAARAAGYSIGELFNRSGVAYREMNMKEQLKSLSEGEALKLLAGNGRLCKRPFAIDGSQVTVGFAADRYKETWT